MKNKVEIKNKRITKISLQNIQNEIPRFVKLQNMGKSKEDINENLKSHQTLLSNENTGKFMNIF